MFQLAQIENLVKEQNDLQQALVYLPNGNARTFIESRLGEIDKKLKKINKGTDVQIITWYTW
ncbi:MAG: hypothetical protein EBU90_11760 [Proteobacteria bacterium]|nr:hypothetical protein [Pseudomonadota bacterium]NBP14507.1 hypothetical protein [bacterium]